MSASVPGCTYHGCRVSPLPAIERFAGACRCKSEIKILRDERTEYRECSVQRGSAP